MACTHTRNRSGGILTTYNDYLLLTQPISSTAVIQSEASIGITNLLPYPGFPTSTSLQGVLYPFPQFPSLEPSVSPTGDSKYDSLQIKATKRFSHGLQAGGAFTWGQGFTSPTGVQDFFNPSGQWASAAADPAAHSDLQLHLHHAESGLPEQD